jgi:hypothetical protein
MRSRPWSLSVLAAFFVIVCISIPVQIALRFEHSLFDVYPIWIKISLLSKVILILCLVNAWLALASRSALLVTSPLLTALVVWNNFLLSQYDPSVPFAQTIAASMGFLLVSGLVFEPASRLVLMHPEKRWWRVARRRRVSFSAVVNAGDVTFQTQTFDLSRTGAFLAHPVDGAVEGWFGRGSLQAEDPVEILLGLPGGRHLALRGAVVRQSVRAVGCYPAGIGIRFGPISLSKKCQLFHALAGK